MKADDSPPTWTLRAWWLEALSVLFAALVAVAWFDPLRLGHRIKVQRVRRDMRVVEDAVARFQSDCGRCPEQLDELREGPKGLAGWGPEPYLEAEQLRDPWGNDYLYDCPSGDELTSLGGDGYPGGTEEAADLSSKTIDDQPEWWYPG